MLEQALIAHASPTMAGLKAASLLSYRGQSSAALRQEVRLCNLALADKGIVIRVLGHCPAQPDLALLYIYRPARLQKILSRADVRTFLAGYGYSLSMSLEQCLSVLSSRLCPQQDFPHEIGIFLDYPLADVVGFIRYHGANYLCKGLWKVYSEPEQAQKRFWQYRHCTQVYSRCYACGYSIIQLTVAV